jgi:hypothetical protein
MLQQRLIATLIVTVACLLAGALAPAPAQAPGKDAQVQPAPYQPVAITLPAPINDPSLGAFRRELADIAQKRDRAALARLVAASFFWIPDRKDTADKDKPAIDSLAQAIRLDGQDGWEVLFDYAAETSASPDRERAGVICTPAQPAYDQQAAAALARATRTRPSDWVYPLRGGVEVRARPQQRAAVVERLGLHLVRVLGAGAESFLEVVTPSGKIGYVAEDSIRDLDGAQMCFAKDDGGWKIAGFYGSH